MERERGDCARPLGWALLSGPAQVQKGSVARFLGTQDMLRRFDLLHGTPHIPSYGRLSQGSP